MQASLVALLLDGTARRLMAQEQKRTGKMILYGVMGQLNVAQTVGAFAQSVRELGGSEAVLLGAIVLD